MRAPSRAAPKTVMLPCPGRDEGAGHSGNGSSSICSVGPLSGTTLIYSSISPSFRKAAPGNSEDKSIGHPLLIFDMQAFLHAAAEGVSAVVLHDKILHPRLCALSSLSLPLSSSFRDTRASEVSLVPPERAVSPVPFFRGNLKQSYLHYLIRLHS